jgi:hypothetical protein
MIRVQRLPTAYLLPIVAQTEIRHFRLNGSSRQNTSFTAAAEEQQIQNGKGPRSQQLLR